MLGSLLAKLRKERFLKQEDVAKQMDFKRPLISKIENGYHTLNAMEVADYAKALGISPDELFRHMCDIIEEYDDDRRE